MAKDLGVIGYTEESRGTQRVDYGAELAGIKGGLNLAADATKGIILAGVEDSLDNEMKKAINDVPVADAPESQRLEDLTIEDLAMYRDMSETDKKELVGLSNRIRQAKNAYAQAPDSSRRNRALFAIKRAQQAAKAKFGFMSDEIDRAATTLQNTSPELFAAAMADQDSIAARAAKDDFLQRMRDDAATMDIPEDIPIESPQFAKMYIEQTRLQYEKAAATRQYETLAALNKLDNKAKLDAMVTEMTAEWGTIQKDLYGPVVKLLSNISVARGDALNGKGTEANVLAANEHWEAMKGQYEAMAIQKKSEINRNFFTIWAGEHQESPEYKAAWGIVQQQIADIEAVEAMIKNNDMNVGEYLKAQSHARGAKLREKMPTFQKIIDTAQGSNFDIWTLTSKLSHTYSSLALEELVSQGLQDELGATFGRHVVDEVAIDGASTWEERRERLRVADTNDPKSGGLTTSPVGSKQHLKEIWGIFEVETIGAKMSVPEELEVPGRADSILKRTAHTLDRFQRGAAAAFVGNPNVNLTDESTKILDFLGGDAFQNVIENASHEERAVFADAIYSSVLAGGERTSTRGIHPQETIYDDLHKDAKRDTWGVPFIDLVEVDTSRIDEEGAIIFTVNEDKARNQLEQEVYREVSLQDPMGFSTDRRAKARLEVEMRKLEQQAARLSKRATQYLRVRAYGGIKPTKNKIDYWTGMRQQRLDTTLIDIFGVEDVSTQ